MVQRDGSTFYHSSNFPPDRGRNVSEDLLHESSHDISSPTMDCDNNSPKRKRKEKKRKALKLHHGIKDFLLLMIKMPSRFPASYTTPTLSSRGPPKQRRRRCVLARPSPRHLGVRHSRRGTAPSQEFCNPTCALQSADMLVVMTPEPRIPPTWKASKIGKRRKKGSMQ